MREVEIRWIDIMNNERIFITGIEMAINNWHAIQQAVDKLNVVYKGAVLEIENIEVVAY